LFWIWDLGFDFRIGAVLDDYEILAGGEDAVTEYLIGNTYKELPPAVKMAIENSNIDFYRIEETISAVAYALYNLEGEKNSGYGTKQKLIIISDDNFALLIMWN
jgi:hypothetical protein